MYLSLFTASFLSATILPFPSEGLFVFALYKHYDPILCLLLAGLGNSLGGAATFLLGRAGRLAVKDGFSGIAPVVQKLGPFSAFFSWLPVIGDIALLALGFLPVQPWKTLFWMSFGKFMRYTALLFFYL